MSLVFLQINDFLRVFDEVSSSVFTESQLASFHFLKKAIDEETLRKKNSKKLERKGERAREREREGGREREREREKESGTLLES